MRNIFLLISACIILALWVSDFFISIEDGNNSKEATPFNISVEDTGESRFNISQLAKVLGVDYKRIEDKNVGEAPSIQEVKISLVAIYISGDKIKVRLRIINGNDEKLLDLMPGDIFQSLTLKKVSTSQIELLNNDDIVHLKMYKPQVISITETKSVEEVQDDK